MIEKTVQEMEEELRKELFKDKKKTESSPILSEHFTQFSQDEREESILDSSFEKYVDFCSQYINFIDLPPKITSSVDEDIWITGLKVNTNQIAAAALFTILAVIFGSVPAFIIGWRDFGFFLNVTGFFFAYILITYPGFASQIIRIRAQEESLLALLYMTIYLRVSPVLERAIIFATQHLDGPLGKDLKQIMWMLDSEEIASIKDGISYFMPLWIKRNEDFVKSFMTLHSVIMQPDKKQQALLLDKSLSTILNDTYSKMRHFSHQLRMPVTLLYTFGLMLPLIGLIAFPMVSVFMSQSVRISYLFFGYIIILPSLIWFFSQRVLAKRPGAFSAPDISKNPDLPPKGMYRIIRDNKEILIPVLPIAIIVGILIMIPGVWHVAFNTIPAFLEAQTLPPGAGIPEELKSEYTLRAMFITLFVPAGLATGIFIYFYGNSAQKIQIRNDVIEIEDDLATSLYQLADQFTENIPLEMAINNFVKNYDLLNLKKRKIYELFSLVVKKMENLGIGFEDVIFHPRYGIIKFYPSTLLQEIMWIFTESSKKGAEILYNILMKISLYLDNTRKIKELIYDLLTDTVSSIRVQAQFLSPFIAAIVGSLTLIIVMALSRMLEQLESIMAAFTVPGANDTGFFTDFVNFTTITPPTLFQVLVGVYMVESVVLLSILTSGVENGFDTIARDHEIAKNIATAIIVYIIITVVAVVSLRSFVLRGISSVGLGG